MSPFFFFFFFFSPTTNCNICEGQPGQRMQKEAQIWDSKERTFAQIQALPQWEQSALTINEHIYKLNVI